MFNLLQYTRLKNQIIPSMFTSGQTTTQPLTHPSTHLDGGIDNKIFSFTLLIGLIDWLLGMALGHFAKLDSDKHFTKTGVIIAVWILYMVFLIGAYFAIRFTEYPKIMLSINFIFRLLVSLTVFEHSYPFFIFFHANMMTVFLSGCIVSFLMSRTNDPDYRSFVINHWINFGLIFVFWCVFLGVTHDHGLDEAGAIAGGFVLAYCFGNYVVLFDRWINKSNDYVSGDCWKQLAELYFNPISTLVRSADCRRR